MPVYFNGRFLRQPQAAVRVDDTALTNIRIRGIEAVGIIGESTGGTPKTALFFQDPANAREVLRDGALLDAVERAYDASTQIPGAFRLVAIRVNPATQSSLALDDSGSTAVINLVSTDFGLHTNFIEVAVETGTVEGKKITVRKDNLLASKDDILRNSFTLTYTGAGTAATASVAFTTERRLTTTVTGGPGGEDLDLDLTTIPTIRDLVNTLNAAAAGVFTATISTLRPDDERPQDLDHVTAVDIKSPAAPELTSTLQAIVDFFNSGEEPFVDATRVAAEGTLPDNLGFTFMTGATEPVPTNTDWQDSFDILGTVQTPLFSVATGSASIHAMGDTHAQFFSSVGRAERIQFVGTDLADTTVAALKVRAQSLNSDRTLLVAQGIKDFDRNGNTVTFPAYIFAAGMAGMFSGSDVGESMTHKFIKATGLETEYRSVDLDLLLEAGVSPLEFVPGRGFRIVQSRMTWTINDAFHHVEASTRLATDAIIREVRKALDEELVGSKGTADLLQRTVSLVETVLLELERNEIIVGDQFNPAFKNIQATLQGDVVFVEFQAAPVIPANFFLVTVHAVPFQGSITTGTVNA